MANAKKIKEKSLHSNEICAPQWLSQVGKNHYRQLVKQLTDLGIYNPLEKGLVEMMAKLYADSRDPETSGKEQRESIKLYGQLIKTLGLRGGKKEEADSEKDLEAFMED